MMQPQLTLPVRLPDEASLANFHISPGNRSAVERLRAQLATTQWAALLHGPPDSGRSHLLQAACQRIETQGQAISYFPLAQLHEYPPQELLAGVERCALVCLDDIDTVIARPHWEEALFHLFNRVLESGNRLLMAARKPPAELPIGLADLRSRLRASLIFALEPLDDEAKFAALQLRAHNRGMTLEPGVARYILQRVPRTMGGLIALLDRLDRDSLQAGRRISIPFVRTVLETYS